jgi:hypothetical protein
MVADRRPMPILRWADMADRIGDAEESTMRIGDVVE